MCQDRSLKLLKKTNKWMSNKEIEKNLKISDASRCMRTLLKSGDVLKREVRVGHVYRHEWKIK